MEEWKNEGERERKRDKKKEKEREREKGKMRPIYLLSLVRLLEADGGAVLAGLLQERRLLLRRQRPPDLGYLL